MQNCLKALRPGDTLVVWRLERLGRTIQQLIKIVSDLEKKQVHLRVLHGIWNGFTTDSPEGACFLKFMSAISVYNQEQITERTLVGVEAVRKLVLAEPDKRSNQVTGRRYKMNADNVRFAAQQLADKSLDFQTVADQVGLSRSSLYRYVSPDGEIRSWGRKLFDDDAVVHVAQNPESEADDQEE